MTPEAELKAAVLEHLKRTGEDVIRLNPGKWPMKRGYMHGAPEGTADLLINRSIPHWIELKAAGNKTKKERAVKQAEFRAKVLALGHRHLTATTVDEVVEFLRAAQ